MARIPIASLQFGANYRQDFDAESLRDLADNMASFGQHTPIIVRPMAGGRYELLAGERRTRAAILLGWSEIDATIRDDMADDAALAATLSENMCRVQTNPIEDGQAFAKLRAMGWDNDRIASAAGVRLDVVVSRLALLTLRDDLQALVSSGQLSIGYARILASGQLDHNRQLLAMVRLRENAAPTPTWFRAIVGQLVEEQAQDCMFNMALLTVQSAGELASIAPTDDLPPLPSTHKPPAPPAPKNGRGVPRKTAIRAMIEYWDESRRRWDELGKTAQAAECQGAIRALEQALLWV